MDRAKKTTNLSPGLSRRRYLGLDLAGAKNSKTTLAIIEFFPKERKIFLLDIHEGLGSEGKKSADEFLIELLTESFQKDSKMGVSAALTLPPCLTKCSSPLDCDAPEVKWGKEFMKMHSRKRTAPPLPRTREFTPYTQRPIELWLRHEILPRLSARTPIDVDETLGGNRAPLTARMIFLKRALASTLGKNSIIEVWPKLSLLALGKLCAIPPRLLSMHRSLEEGTHAREEILEYLSRELELFIYEKDAVKLIRNLPSFDAFLCACTALLSDLNRCMKPPTGFKESWGWMAIPDWTLKDQHP